MKHIDDYIEPERSTPCASLQKRNFWVALAGLCVIILTPLLTILKAISII